MFCVLFFFDDLKASKSAGKKKKKKHPEVKSVLAARLFCYQREVEMEVVNGNRMNPVLGHALSYNSVLPLQR